MPVFDRRSSRIVITCAFEAAGAITWPGGDCYPGALSRTLGEKVGEMSVTRGPPYSKTEVASKVPLEEILMVLWRPPSDYHYT